MKAVNLNLAEVQEFTLAKIKNRFEEKEWEMFLSWYEWLAKELFKQILLKTTDPNNPTPLSDFEMNSIKDFAKSQSAKFKKVYTDLSEDEHVYLKDIMFSHIRPYIEQLSKQCIAKNTTVRQPAPRQQVTYQQASAPKRENGVRWIEDTFHTCTLHIFDWD